MTTTQAPHWTAHRVLAKRSHLVARELESGELPVFRPTYARAWYRDGKSNAKECELMPGYIFVQGAVPEVDGMLGCVGAVTEAEMFRMRYEHLTHRHDSIERAPEVGRRRVRRRRPRPGRRWREMGKGAQAA